MSAGGRTPADSGVIANGTTNSLRNGKAGINTSIQGKSNNRGVELVEVELATAAPAGLAVPTQDQGPASPKYDNYGAGGKPSARAS